MKRYTAILLTASIQAGLVLGASAAQYTLTLVNAKIVGGASDGLSTATINEGAVVTIAPVVPAGKTFDVWQSSDPAADVLGDPFTQSTTVTMPAEDITITANLIDVYTIAMVNGTVDPQQAEYQLGNSVTVSAPDPSTSGRPFAGWTVVPAGAVVFGDSSKPTTLATITGVSQACTITANYAMHLAVTNGTGTGDYAPGAQVVISASVPAGKVFAGWTGDTAALNNPNSQTAVATLNGDVSVVATFKSQYLLSVTGGTGSGTFLDGADAPISATVPSGKVFTGWTGDTATVADVNSASTTVKMNGNVSVTATFKTVYHLIVNNGAGTGDYPDGADATIAATVPTGKAFTGWTGTTATVADVTSATTTVKMTGNMTVTATFKSVYHLNVNGGTGSGDFIEGTTQAIAANAAPDGQAFDRWTGDVSLVANVLAPQTTVLMSRPVTVTATYKSTQTNTNPNNNTNNDADSSGTNQNGTDNPSGQNVPQDTSTNQDNGQQAPSCGFGVLPGAGMTIAGLLCLSLTQRRRSF